MGGKRLRIIGAGVCRRRPTLAAAGTRRARLFRNRPAAARPAQEAPMIRRPRTFALASSAVLLAVRLAGAEPAAPLGVDAKIARAQAYAAAIARSDYHAAKALLAQSARVYYEKREGD